MIVDFSYLLPLLKFTNEYHNYNTRAANNKLLVQNKPNCELFKTCMQYYGSQLWNSLPPHLKTIDDVNQFKHDYKQHLHTNYAAVSKLIHHNFFIVFLNFRC